MEIRDLKKISISNLILIILNNRNNDLLRRCAEVELRKRIKNVGWHYDDLLHFDDKAIQQRGLDVENYLISPNVNMQQLMETYFMYDWQADYQTNFLLFSEKHLCNEDNFASPFFTRICTREIDNLTQRADATSSLSQRDVLLSFKQLLEERNKKCKQDKTEILKDDPIELLCHNEAMYQLDEDVFLELMYNLRDDEMYELLSSRLGMLKVGLLQTLNETLLDPDLAQYLYGLSFVKRDELRLYSQKRQLMRQVKNGFNVNYGSEKMQRALQRVKK